MANVRESSMLSAQDVLEALDADWSDDEVRGISSSEEEELDQEMGVISASSRQVFGRYLSGDVGLHLHSLRFICMCDVAIATRVSTAPKGPFMGRK